MHDDTGADAGDATLASVLGRLASWREERQALVGSSDAGLPAPADWPALPALQEMRGLWAGLRNREQLRRALQPAPADAGPLNSVALVSRMLRLMHETSPGYLQHFTAYVDVLVALQEPKPRDGSQDADAAPRGKRAKPRRGRKAPGAAAPGD
ncbi:MAG TPA: DUF2894 domain-containing protein, partial [Luteimonas sp.]